ncbi:MAG: hypothetical protein ACPG41_03835 [Lacinutrix venerupis]
MKTLKIILAILAFAFSVFAIAQEKKADSTLVKKNNLLDMGANVISQVFGSNLDGNTDGKTIGYLELLEKSDLSEAEKTEYKNLYHIQAKDLTQKQKDSLGKAIEKRILEAKETDD